MIAWLKKLLGIKRVKNCQRAMDDAQREDLQRTIIDYNSQTMSGVQRSRLTRQYTRSEAGLPRVHQGA